MSRKRSRRPKAKEGCRVIEAAVGEGGLLKLLFSCGGCGGKFQLRTKFALKKAPIICPACKGLVGEAQVDSEFQEYALG